MRKILVVFHPILDVEKSPDLQEQYPPHHYWCYDQLSKTGHQVDILKTNLQPTLVDRVGNKLGINFLQQQIDCLRAAKHYDLIFFPFMEFSFALALLKILKIFNKPVIAVAQYAYQPNRKNILKKIKSQGIRNVYFRGTDLIIFYNEHLFRASNNCAIKGRSLFVDHWGVDTDYFQAYTKAQVQSPSKEYFYSTGGSFRDFNTLVSAFKLIDYPLKITTIGALGALKDCTLTPNIKIDNSLPFGSTAKIRKEYYNALAVAVPLYKPERLDTSGITVVMEALAMGKPVISTHNRSYPFNLEREKVGLNVAYGDIEGWRQAAQYMIDHPDEVKEMGERAKYLTQKRFNYKLFTKGVNHQIAKFLQDAKPFASTSLQVQKEAITSKTFAKL